MESYNTSIEEYVNSFITYIRDLNEDELKNSDTKDNTNKIIKYLTDVLTNSNNNIKKIENYKKKFKTGIQILEPTTGSLDYTHIDIKYPENETTYWANILNKEVFNSQYDTVNDLVASLQYNITDAFKMTNIETNMSLIYWALYVHMIKEMMSKNGKLSLNIFFDENNIIRELKGINIFKTSSDSSSSSSSSSKQKKNKQKNSGKKKQKGGEEKKQVLPNNVISNYQNIFSINNENNDNNDNNEESSNDNTENNQPNKQPNKRPNKQPNKQQNKRSNKQLNKRPNKQQNKKPNKQQQSQPQTTKLNKQEYINILKQIKITNYEEKTNLYNTISKSIQKYFEENQYGYNEYFRDINNTTIPTFTYNPKAYKEWKEIKNNMCKSDKNAIKKALDKIIKNKSPSSWDSLKTNLDNYFTEKSYFEIDGIKDLKGLVFTDPVTGLEYAKEENQLPGGSNKNIIYDIIDILRNKYSILGINYIGHNGSVDKKVFDNIRNRFLDFLSNISERYISTHIPLLELLRERKIMNKSDYDRLTKMSNGSSNIMNNKKIMNNMNKNKSKSSIPLSNEEKQLKIDQLINKLNIISNRKIDIYEVKTKINEMINKQTTINNKNQAMNKIISMLENKIQLAE